MSSTAKKLRTADPLPHPFIGQREPARGDATDESIPVGQLGLEFNTPLAHSVELHRIVREVVEEVYGGQDALAAEMGVSRQIVGLRLRRAQDSKGDTQKANLDVVAFVWNDPRARWALLTKLCVYGGAKPPEPARAPTADERARLLGRAVTPEMKRLIERDNGLPIGSLDP